MRILKVTNSDKPGGIQVTAILGDGEFKQLKGDLNVAVFARSAIDQPAKAIKTGARHSFAKYLLFPAKIRRRVHQEEFDWNGLRCGVLRYKSALYVIYEVPGISAPREASRH